MRPRYRAPASPAGANFPPHQTQSFSLPLKSDSKKSPTPIPRHSVPLLGSQISVDANLRPPYRRCGKARHNQRQMAGTRNHRMVAIRVALHRTARMRVNIRHDLEPALLADLPQLPEITTIKPHDPTVEAVRVEIVVKHEVLDPRSPVAAAA